MSFTECLHWPFCPGVLIAILAFTAAAVAFRKDPSPSEKGVWILVFLGLMWGEVWMMGKDRTENNRKQKETRDAEIASFRAIGDGIQVSITNSQSQFSATMSGIKQSINTVTGGDSFCFIKLDPSTFNNISIMNMSVGQVGRYPLRSVYAIVDDWQKLREAATPGRIFDPSLVFRQINIGDLAVGGAHFLPGFRRDELDKYSYTVFFHGLNGSWAEEIRLRKVNDVWMHAVKVTRDRKTLFEKVDSGYPRLAGAPDWNP